MIEEKKKTKLDLIWRIIGIEGLVKYTGLYVSIIVGSSIIIRELLNSYYLFPNPNYVVTLGFMIAILSVPVSISYYFLNKMFGGEKDE